MKNISQIEWKQRNAGKRIISMCDSFSNYQRCLDTQDMCRKITPNNYQSQFGANNLINWLIFFCDIFIEKKSNKYLLPLLAVIQRSARNCFKSKAFYLNT